jgi:DNA-directed RNA polymerase subunit RPC12/RpoP
MNEYTYRCLNCGNPNINYKWVDNEYDIVCNLCNLCGSRRVIEVTVKGNPSQRQAIRAGYDQVRPGLWLHFAAKRMIVHKYRGDCPWSIFVVGKGSKGWLEVFSFETLSGAL